MKIGFLYSRVRTEEKLLLEAFSRRGVNLTLLHDRDWIYEATSSAKQLTQWDLIVERCISHSRSLSSLWLLNKWGTPTVNSAAVTNICSNKLLTTSALAAAGIPCPRTRIAYSRTSAMAAIESLGYPVVLKPAVGSWGRLVSKITNREAAEALLEHNALLGDEQHSVFFIQEYIDKAMRDIRAFVVGDEAVCAIYRKSEHWITNTARGAKTSNCPVTPELNELCAGAACAVGGGVLAIDILEDATRGALVNEINHVMEFRNSIEPTGVNIPEIVIDFCLNVARHGWVTANGWDIK